MAKPIDLLPSIALYRKEHSAAETAQKFGVHECTIRRWGIYSENYEKLQNCPNQLTDLQVEVLTGNLLGDGSLTHLKKGRQSNFTLAQKSTRLEYVEWLQQTYGPFSYEVVSGKTRKPINILNKINHQIENWIGEYCYRCGFYTVAHPVFTFYRKKWYKEPDVKRSPKVIPDDLKLTWQAAAIWTCDDGSNHVEKKYNNKHIVLHTESFTKEDVEFILSCLQRDLNVVGTINYHNSKPIIRIGRNEWSHFVEGVKPYIPWACFKYKCVDS
jgi:hypothetical protein